MQEQSSVHAYLDWTKRRLDEMDATVASLEAKARQLHAESRARADEFIDRLKKQRGEFLDQIQAQGKAGEAAVSASRAQLERQWDAFEAQVGEYFSTVGQQVDQHQATFREAAAAQARAWKDAADELHAEATRAAASRRTDIEAVLEQMTDVGTQAQARLQELQKSGSEAWSALGAALTESRKAFDRAADQAWKAFSRSTSGTSGDPR